MFVLPLSRSDQKRIFDPSGDQPINPSRAGLSVSRVSPPLATTTTYTSQLALVSGTSGDTVNAMRRPSGDQIGSPPNRPAARSVELFVMRVSWLPSALTI